MMKLFILVFFVLLIIGAANAESTTGNDYLRGDKSFQLGYAIGFWEGTNLGEFYSKTNGINLDALSKCTDNWERAQFVAVVDKYLEKNPQRWNEPMYKLIIDAINDAYKKRQR